CNFVPLVRPFFNQGVLLMQFCPSCTSIFQSRSVLDAILSLLYVHFSIKECSLCNFDPFGWFFFNQVLFLIQFCPSCTPIFQSRSALDAILSLLYGHFSIKESS